MGDPREDTLLPGPYLHTSSSSSFGPFRSDWSGCSEQFPYFTHSGPTPRLQDPPFQFRNPLIGALRGCPIVFRLFFFGKIITTKYRLHSVSLPYKIKLLTFDVFSLPFPYSNGSYTYKLQLLSVGQRVDSIVYSIINVTFILRVFYYII